MASKTIFLPSRQYRSGVRLQKHAKLVCCQCLRLRETSLIPGLPQNQTNTFPLPSPFHQVSISHSNPRINLENRNTFWPTPNTHSPEKEEYRNAPKQTRKRFTQPRTRFSFLVSEKHGREKTTTGVRENACPSMFLR